jgi:hypothetical protein
MDLLVNEFAQESELIKAKDAINNLNVIFHPFHKPLTARARQGMRAVGTSRYGLVKIVEKMSLQYDSKLSKEDNAVNLAVRVSYLDRIRQLKIAVLNFYEALDDTDKAVGHDVMAHVDKFSASLQIARQHDGDIDEAMKELDEYNSRFGASMTEEDTNPDPKGGTTPETPEPDQN